MFEWVFIMWEFLIRLKDDRASHSENYISILSLHQFSLHLLHVVIIIYTIYYTISIFILFGVFIHTLNIAR